jgi:hypothetical protein
MIRRKLVDASIALTAFVLIGAVGDILSPRLALAAPFEYCDAGMVICPASFTTCAGCLPAVTLVGTCRYNGAFCGRAPIKCWSAFGTCSCWTDAC